MGVAAPYRPTLPALLAERGVSRRNRWLLAAVAVLVGLAIAALLLTGGRDETRVVIRDGAVPFNFRYPAQSLKRVPPRGSELVRLEQRRPNGLFLQSFAVTPLVLGPYRGEPGGYLPVHAAGVIDRLRERYRDFELIAEGKTRVVQAVAYNISFQARRDGRRLYGRVVLLPEQEPGARQGLVLTLEATPAAGVPRALDVGVRGAVKRPFRTLRLGTEGP